MEAKMEDLVPQQDKGLYLEIKAIIYQQQLCRHLSALAPNLQQPMVVIKMIAKLQILIQMAQMDRLAQTFFSLDLSRNQQRRPYLGAPVLKILLQMHQVIPNKLTYLENSSTD